MATDDTRSRYGVMNVGEDLDVGEDEDARCKPVLGSGKSSSSEYAGLETTFHSISEQS